MAQARGHKTEAPAARFLFIRTVALHESEMAARTTRPVTFGAVSGENVEHIPKSVIGGTGGAAG